MIFEKFIDTDLGHVSYIVACDQTGDAFIVDPRRDDDEYIKFIERNNLHLKYIFNTHTHADYVGGHIELAYHYGAVNIFHKSAPITNYSITKVSENDSFDFGTLKVKIIETPGHTPFDISLLVNEKGIDKLLFTGDLLFVGDVGRPDLLGEENLESLAIQSYISSKKLWSLADEIIVLPSHIQGSLCGKSLGKHFFSTIGIEKKTNNSFALSQKTREEYSNNLTEQKIETPAFFKKMAVANIDGPVLINELVNKISDVWLDEFDDTVQIIDIRHPREFNRGHIKNSINIYEGSNVSLIAGSLVNYEKDIYLIGNNESNFDLFMIKLFRVGLDNVKGIIRNSFEELKHRLVISQTILPELIDNSFVNIVLDEGSYSEVGNTISSNMSDFPLLNIDQFTKVVVTCRQGYKSAALISCYPRENLYIIE